MTATFRRLIVTSSFVSFGRFCDLQISPNFDACNCSQHSTCHVMLIVHRFAVQFFQLIQWKSQSLPNMKEIVLTEVFHSNGGLSQGHKHWQAHIVGLVVLTLGGPALRES